MSGLTEIEERMTFGWRGTAPIDSPEEREQLEGLVRDKAYRKIREKMKAELDQRVNDLKRADTGTFLSLQ